MGGNKRSGYNNYNQYQSNVDSVVLKMKRDKDYYRDKFKEWKLTFSLGQRTCDLAMERADRMLQAKNALNEQKQSKKLSGSKKAYAVVIMVQIIKEEKINIEPNDLMKYGFTEEERTSREQIESARKKLLDIFPIWKKYDTPSSLMPSYCKKLELNEEHTRDAQHIVEQVQNRALLEGCQPKTIVGTSLLLLYKRF